jgi:peroxiredoxin
MMRSRFSTLLLLGLLQAALCAGEYNQTLSLGDAVPAWKDLPGVDGEKHSLAEVPAEQFVVVVFTCNSCPVARDYEDRIMALSAEHQGQVSVVAINVNTIAEDRLDKMQARATERKFNFPYLYDQTQQIAKDYGATGTPEFFLLSKVQPASAPTGVAGERVVLYMGALDDHAEASKVTKHYLADAIAAAKTGGKAAVGETFANGCRIRFARTRREE